jgi:nucleoside diphosphate kinase
MERTLVMIKPDGLTLSGKHTSADFSFPGVAVSELIDNKMTIRRMETRALSKSEAETLYQEHAEKWYFRRNVDHVTSGPVMLMEVVGENAVTVCRDIIKSLRLSYQFWIELPNNLIHATDDINKAEHELNAVGFKPFKEQCP